MYNPYSTSISPSVPLPDETLNIRTKNKQPLMWAGVLIGSSLLLGKGIGLDTLTQPFESLYYGITGAITQDPYEQQVSTENRLFIPKHEGTYRTNTSGRTYVQVNRNPLQNIKYDSGYYTTSQQDSDLIKEGPNLTPFFTALGLGSAAYGLSTLKGISGGTRLKQTGIVAGIGLVGGNIITSINNGETPDLPSGEAIIGTGVALGTGWLGRALGIHMEGQLVSKTAPRTFVDTVFNPHIFTTRTSLNTIKQKGNTLPVDPNDYDYVIGKGILGIGKQHWGRKWAPSITSAMVGGISMGTSSLLSGSNPQDILLSTAIGAMGGSFIGGYLLSNEEIITKMRSPAVAGILGFIGGLNIVHTVLGSREPKDSNDDIKLPNPNSPLYSLVNPDDIKAAISKPGVSNKDNLVTPWLEHNPFDGHFKGLNLTEKEYKILGTQAPLDRLQRFDKTLLTTSPYDDIRQYKRVNTINEQSTSNSKTADYISPIFLGYQALFLTSTVGLLALGGLDERVENIQRIIDSKSNITDSRRNALLGKQGIAGIAQPFAHGFSPTSLFSSTRAKAYVGLMAGIGGLIGADLGNQSDNIIGGTVAGGLAGVALALSVPALVNAKGGQEAVKRWRPFSFAQGLDDLKQKEEIWKAQRNLGNVGASLLQDVSDTSLRTKGMLTLGMGFGLGAAAGTALSGDPTIGTFVGGSVGLLTGAYVASMHKRRVTSVRSALTTAGVDIASTTGKVIPSILSYTKNEFINTVKGLTISLYPLSRVVYNTKEIQHQREDDLYGRESIDPLDKSLKGSSDNPLSNNYFFSPIKLLESSTADKTVKEQRDLVRYYKSGARYGGEYTSTNDPGTIQLYDQTRVGEGFMEFLKNVDVGSARGAFYSVSTDEEVMRLLSRASQKEGIITSYAQLKLNPFNDPFSGEAIGAQSQEELSKYFGGYVTDVLKKEGVGAAANAFFTSNIYSWINSASSALGFGPLIKYDDQVNGQGIYLDRQVVAVEGAIAQSTKSLPTYLSTLAVSAEAPIVSLYKRLTDVERQKLLSQDPTSFSTGGVNPFLGGVVGGILGGGAGSLLGKDLGGRMKGGIAGAAIGSIIGASLGISSFIKLLPGMGNMGDSSIFHTKFGGQSEYIIHSKMIMGTIHGEKVAYVSTGNIGAMYKAYKGEADQMNYGMFISERSRYGAEIIHDLEVTYDAIKVSSPGQDLNLSRMKGDSVVVGGPVAGTERDSRKQWRDFITKATKNKDDILWTTAYSQGIDTNDLLYKHLEQGSNVTIVMQNPYGAKGGGFREGTQNMLVNLLQKSLELKKQREQGIDVGELKVIINPSFSETLQHSKMMIAGSDIWLGSHNFSNNSFNKVFEIALKLQNQKGLADSLKSSVLGAAGTNGFTDITDLFSRVIEGGKSLSDFEKMLASKDFNESLNDASQLTLFNELNISGQFFPLFKDKEESGTLLINPRMGASYFHSRSLYNNLQRQGRAYHRVVNSEDVGIASSLYKMAYIAKINERAKSQGIFNPVYSDLKYIPGVVQAYDKELYTQGLGNVINERIFMPLGMGRVYKDEVGFLPSLMGGFGQMLDRTYLFYSGNQTTQGLTTPYADISSSSNKYQERAGQPGLFESVFSQGTFLLQSSAQALIFYMTIGEPLNLLLSEAFKSSTESLIHDSLSGDYKTFNSLLNKTKRQYLLGQGALASNPVGAKIGLIDTIDRMKGIQTSFYGASNFSPTIYHMNSLMMRTRSASLLENVIKPFLLGVMNPYTNTDLKSQRGFISVIDAFIEKVGSPIELTPIYNASQSKKITDTISTRSNILQEISHLIPSNQTISGSSLINRVDDAIAYTHSRHLMVDNIKQFITANGLSISFGGGAGSIHELETLVRETSRAVANNTTLSNQFYGVLNNSNVSPFNIDTNESRSGRVYDYRMTEEGVLINSINFKITNEGIDRASTIALKLQGILDEIPLNPLYWSIFNKYDWARKITGEKEQGYKRVELASGLIIPKVKTIGDVLSFTELTERIRDITFGKGGISEHFTKAKVQSQYDWLHEIQALNSSGQPTTGTEEQLDTLNSHLKANVKSVTDKLHSFWNATIGFGIDAGTRVLERYQLIKGNPFDAASKGILQSSIALKNFEYHLLTLFPETSNPSLRGIQWGDDPHNLGSAVKKAEVAAKDIWANRTTISTTEFIRTYGLFINEDDFVNNYINRYLYKHSEDIDPLTRQINAIDEYAIKQLQKVHSVQEFITQRAIGARTGTQPLSNVMDGDLWIEAHERLRSETMGLFRMGLINEKQLQSRLVKISHGLGLDATGKVTKSKGITTALSIISIFSVFGDQVMRNTSGVSLTTQLAYSLFMGGGPVGKLLGNKEGELKVNTEFDADRILPDLPFLGRTGTVIASNLAVLGVASVLGTSTLRTEAVSYGFVLDKLISRIKLQKTNGTPFGIDLQYMVDEVGPLPPGATPGKVAKLLSDHSALNAMTSAQLKAELRTAENLRLVFNVGSDSFSFTSKLQGNQASFRALRTGGNLWFNTAVSYLALSFGMSALTKGVSSVMNYMRDSTSTLDPMAYALLGSVALGMGTKKFSMGLLGFLGGAGVGYLSNALGINLLSIGSKGSQTDNVQGTIISQLSSFRHGVRGNLRNASRAELMAAIMGEGIESKFSLLKQDVPAKEAKVIARQVTFPLVQFFSTTKVIGEQVNASGKVVREGDKYFYLGIQGPPITGMSMALSLPFKILKTQPGVLGEGQQRGGVLGLAINEEADLLDYLYQVGMVTTSFALLGNTLKGLGRLTNLITRKPLEANPIYSMGKGISNMSKFLEDVMLLLPSSITKAGMYLSTANLSNLQDVLEAKKYYEASKLKPAWEKTFQATGKYSGLVGKGIAGYLFGNIIGRVGFGLKATSSKDIEANSDQYATTTGVIIGGLNIGFGLLQNKITSPILLTGSKGIMGHINKAMDLVNNPKLKNVRKMGFSMGLFSAAAMIMTDSNFGLFQGMDTPYAKERQDYFDSHQLLVSLGYGITMGAIATSVGGMGSTSADVLEDYKKVLDDPNPSMIKKIFTFNKVSRLTEEAEQVYEYIRSKGNFIDRRYKLIQQIDPANIGVTPEFHLNKIKEIFDQQSFTSMRQALSSDYANDILFSMRGVKGAYIDKALFSNRIFKRFIKAPIGVVIGTAIGAGTLNLLNPKVFNANNFYTWLQGEGVYADGKQGKGLGIRNVIADITRLMTFTDRSLDSGVELDKVFRSGQTYGGQNFMVTNEKLLLAKGGFGQELNKTVQGLSELLVLDDVNTFLSGPGGFGITLRRGEEGTIVTPYFQLQASGTDISAAAYSMASKFLFKTIAQSGNELSFEVQNAMKGLDAYYQAGIQPPRSKARKAALGILLSTSSLQPRQKPRRINQFNTGTESALSNASLAMSLEARNSLSRNLAYQPSESLISRLYLDAMTTSHRNLDNLLRNRISSLGSAQEGIGNGKDLSDYLFGDPFYITNRKVDISNIKFFVSDPKSKRGQRVKGTKGGQGDVYNEYSNLHLDTYIGEDKDLLFSPLIQKLDAVINTLPQPIPLLLYGGLLIGLPLYVLPMVLGDKKIRAEATEKGMEAMKISSERWFTNVDKDDQIRAAWNFRSSYPLPGQSSRIISGGENVPILYKGNYQLELNKALGLHAGFGREFASELGKLQYQLDEIRFKLDPSDPNRVLHLSELLNSDGIVSKIKTAIHGGILESVPTGTLNPSFLNPSSIEHLTGSPSSARKLVEELGIPSSAVISTDRVTWKTLAGEDIAIDININTLRPGDYSVNVSYNTPTGYTSRGIVNITSTTTDIRQLLNALTGVSIPEPSRMTIVTPLVSLPTTNITTEFQLDPTRSIKENLFAAKKAQVKIKGASSGFPPAATNEIDTMVSTLEQLYTTHISSPNYVSSVTNQLTDVYMGHMNRMVDRYVDTLMDSFISVDENTARGLYKALDIPSDQIDAFISAKYKAGVTSIKVKTAALFVPGIELNTLLSIESEADLYEAIQNMGNIEYQQRMAIDSEGHINMRQALKDRAKISVNQYLNDIISQLNLNVKDFAEVLGTGELGNPDFQAKMITHKLMLAMSGGELPGEEGFFSVLRHHWGGLAMQPQEGVKRTLTNALKGLINRVRGHKSNYMTVGEESANRIISSVNRPRKIVPSASPSMGTTESEDMRRFVESLVNHQTHRTNVISKYSKGVFTLINYLGFGVDVLEAINIFGSFAYFGSVYNNPNTTQAQRKLAARGIGVSMTMYVGSLFQNVLSIGVMSVGSLLVAQLGLPLVLAGALGLAIAGGVGLMATSKETRKGIKKTWNKIWEGSVDFFSETAYNVAEGTLAMGLGGRGVSTIFGAVGGALAGVGLGLGVIGFMTSLTLLTGMAAVAAPLGIIAASALTLGLIGGALGFISPRGIGEATQGFLNGLNNFKIGGVPIFNIFINTAQEAESLLLQGISGPISGLNQGTPFTVGTVNDVIAQEYKKFLYSSKDVTGKDAASNFISPTIYGRAPTQSNSVVNRYGDFMSIKPDGLIDPSIQRELNIRGQMFNQSIIGAYTWRVMLVNSTNINAIRRAQASTPAKIYLNKSQEEVVNISSELRTLSIPSYSVLNTSKNKTHTYSSGAISFTEGLIETIERVKVAVANTKQPLNVEFDINHLNNTATQSREVVATHNLFENPVHYGTGLIEANNGSQISVGFNTSSDTIASINQLPYST